MGEEWEDALVRDVSRATSSTHKCPHCGYRFSIFQSRGIACVGCRNSVLNCPNIRCPKCDYEFKLVSSGNNMNDELMVKGISSFIKKDMKNFGERFG